MRNLHIHIYGYNNEHDVMFTRSSRIHREIVVIHAIVSKRSAPFTLKHNPGVIRLKQVCSAFKRLCFLHTLESCKR